MADVYVNLHLTYTYANVIISNGYIKELKEYVRLVDWIDWDWMSIKGKPLLRISGGFDDDAIERHLERTRVFLQRVMNSGSHKIYVRNKRNDEWLGYQPTIQYTVKQMEEIEKQRLEELYREKWIREDLNKLSKMNQQKEDEFIRNMILKKRQEFDELIKAEKLRQESIKEIW